MGRPTIKSYEQADAFLGRSDSLSTGQRGTRIVRESATKITVWYHDTPVVTYYQPGTNTRVATIDTQGWKTPTTISRINEYAPEGIGVYAAGQEGPEFVLLSDDENGVIDYPMSQGPYHMDQPTPARR